MCYSGDGHREDVLCPMSDSWVEKWEMDWHGCFYILFSNIYFCFFFQTLPLYSLGQNALKSPQLVIPALQDLTEVQFSSYILTETRSRRYTANLKPYHSSLLPSRVALAFGVQQPDASNDPHQPGDVVLHQQPIAELHFCSTQDISESCSSRWQAEGRVSRLFTPVAAVPCFTSLPLWLKAWKLEGVQQWAENLSIPS